VGKVSNDTVKWLSLIVAIVLLTAAGVGAHFTASSKIDETSRRLSTFETSIHEDIVNIREWMKTLSDEQREMGKGIAALVAQEKVRNP